MIKVLLNFIQSIFATTSISKLETDQHIITTDQPRKTSLRVLSLATLSISGAITIGLIGITFSAWVGALATIFGGVWGLFFAALFWVGGGSDRGI